VRKDGRSQRGALANNLAADAADMGQAVHRAGECAKCATGVERPAEKLRLTRLLRIACIIGAAEASFPHRL
jgi:hypothetical protein